MARDPLECEIERLVKAGDLAGILKWAEFLEKEQEKGFPVRAIFKATNEKGQSLLHVALSADEVNLEICQWLFEQLKEDEILLSDDADGGSLVWFAAKANLPELALMLIKYQSTAPQFADKDKKQRESWLRSSASGVTPLHLAAGNPKSELLTFLMEQGDIHKRDKSGSTPLIHAALFDEYDNIALLINHGADMYASNSEGRTFFYYFEKFPEEEKINVFRQLANEHQLVVLQYYRNKLADIRQLDEKKQSERDAVYGKLMAQRVAMPRSLQELILSKMPYEATADFPVLHAFPDEVLQIVPDYRRRIFPKSPISKSHNQVLDEDRETVRLLLEKTEAYLVDLSERPPVLPIRSQGSYFSIYLLRLRLAAVSGLGVFVPIILASLLPQRLPL